MQCMHVWQTTPDSHTESTTLGAKDEESNVPGPDGRNIVVSTMSAELLLCCEFMSLMLCWPNSTQLALCPAP